jgi:hypothetical protein
MLKHNFNNHDDGLILYEEVKKKRATSERETKTQKRIMKNCVLCFFLYVQWNEKSLNDHLALNVLWSFSYFYILCVALHTNTSDRTRCFFNSSYRGSGITLKKKLYDDTWNMKSSLLQNMILITVDLCAENVNRRTVGLRQANGTFSSYCWRF